MLNRVTLSQYRFSDICAQSDISTNDISVKWQAISYVRGKDSKLGEPCPKVRLSQDRLPIVICPHEKARWGGKVASWVSPLRPTSHKCRSSKCRFVQMSLRGNVAQLQYLARAKRKGSITLTRGRQLHDRVRQRRWKLVLERKRDNLFKWVNGDVDGAQQGQGCQTIGPSATQADIQFVEQVEIL